MTSPWRERVEEERNLFGGIQRYIKLESGRKVTFLDAKGQADAGMRKAHLWYARMARLATEDQRERLEWYLDDVERWVSAMRHHLEKERQDKAKRERIAAMRNTLGRTPEEAEMYLRKADKLEAELQQGGR